MAKVIWFASCNKNKVRELQRFFHPYGYLVRSLLDLAESLNIIEDGTSYQANALLKVQVLARYLDDHHLNDDSTIIIGDDTGLEIAALDNFPGIFSERWKGDMSFHQAMAKILEKLKDKTNRKATMITALAYFNNKNKMIKVFIGKLEGEIAQSISETQGFGYDSFFYLPEYQVTLSQLSKDKKNEISHRGQALQQLVTFLNISK